MVGGILTQPAPAPGGAFAAALLLSYGRRVGTDAGDPGARAARLTVAFLLYNAEAEVEALVESLLVQRHPSFASQAEWLQAVLVDDASRDGTVAAARRALEARGEPAHVALVVHGRNLGLAATLNELFALARTPFVLTCHLDCRFGSEGYAAALLDLIERHPEAAAVSGQPRLAPRSRLPFAEKLNVVVNLMDVVGEPADAELSPVGFAEGRCDVFRVEAMRAVGLYDTRLRTSGEDQVLAAKLRAKGYSIYKAPRLEYYLSVSGEQDSVGKLLRHQHLFGRTTPYIVLAVRGSWRGLVGSEAGGNRTRRALLRALQLFGSAAWLFAMGALGAGAPAWLWAGPPLLVLAARLALQSRHARAVGFTAADWVAWAALQPAVDFAFGAGIVEGLWRVAFGDRATPIE
jgi:GT2 family glycosyltransferase